MAISAGPLFKFNPSVSFHLKCKTKNEVDGIFETSFTLLGQEFGAMDSAREHKFAFNEAISFIVPCETQGEIDYFWERLSADPKGGQCGWLKDRYGLSWQITPTIMSEMLGGTDKNRTARVTKAFLKMKKFDIEALKRAYEEE
jgi:predicted 3-demethylubiquinone-9 3-methyltransferase (glyoxalase superfamily)